MEITLAFDVYSTLIDIRLRRRGVPRLWCVQTSWLVMTYSITTVAIPWWQQKIYSPSQRDTGQYQFL
jgi:hypothetical protein